MATKQIKKLSDLQKITTATGDQMIPVVDASGNVNPIKLTDLAQVVAVYQKRGAGVPCRMHNLSKSNGK